jgi:hypothetical protein
MKSNKNGIHIEGDDTYWYKEGIYHREDGPACVYGDGDFTWYINGKRHRLDGPAVKWGNDMEWWIEGKRSCLKGPAVIKFGARIKEWWFENNLIYDNTGTINNVHKFKFPESLKHSIIKHHLLGLEK